MATSSAPLPLPRGCAWGCLVIGVLLALLGVGSLLGLSKCWQRAQERWIEAPGAITECYLKEGTRVLRIRSSWGGHSSETTYSLQLKYRYRVDGRDFTGEAKSLRQPENDDRREEALAVAAAYRAGDHLAVFHHPADSSKSRLTEKEPGIEFGKDVFSTLVFLAGAAAALFLGRRILRSPIPPKRCHPKS